jgi:hypothetical protein
MAEPAQIETEFQRLSLGDERLERRAHSIISRAVAAPARSFPDLLPTDAELEGAYRFFQNESVSPEALMRPHIRATLGRVRVGKVVRIAHDTTALSFGGVRDGLGTLGGGGCGFWGQFALAVSADEERAPLGVVGLTTKVYPTLKEKALRFERLRRQWRANKRKGTKGERTPFPRAPTVWEGVEKWCTIPLALRARLKGVRAIHVMDQEADNFGVLFKLKSSGIHFVIRGSSSRRIAAATATNSVHVGDQLAAAETVVTRRVKLTARPKATQFHPRRDEREATLVVRASRVTLSPAGAGEFYRATLALNVVEVIELEPPAGEEPIEWCLYTTEPIGTPAAVAAVVDHYRARWRLEEYFKALKTGCSIEKRQLTDFDALMRALALFIPIAWHLLALRTAAHRTVPVAAQKLLAPLQLTVLRALAKERNVDLSSDPSAREALWAIAALGGHLKRNGGPGWLTIGRGYDKLRSAESVWRMALASAEEK